MGMKLALLKELVKAKKGNNKKNNKKIKTYWGAGGVANIHANANQGQG